MQSLPPQKGATPAKPALSFRPTPSKPTKAVQDGKRNREPGEQDWSDAILMHNNLKSEKRFVLSFTEKKSLQRVLQKKGILFLVEDFSGSRGEIYLRPQIAPAKSGCC